MIGTEIRHTAWFQMRTLVCIALMMAVTPLGALAQDDKTAWASLQRIKAGKNVHVTRIDSSVAKGKFLRFSQEGIFLEVSNQAIEIQRNDVQKVVLQQGRGKHIAIASAIGAGLGLGVLARGSTEGSWTAVFVPIGAGGGAAIGAALPPGHSVVYERDASDNNTKPPVPSPAR